MSNDNPSYPTAKSLSDALHGAQHQNHFMARCPAHDDAKASLSIREKKGKVLFHCHAGCTQADVLDALRARGLWPECKERSIIAAYDDATAGLTDKDARTVAKRMGLKPSQISRLRAALSNRDEYVRATAFQICTAVNEASV